MQSQQTISTEYNMCANMYKCVCVCVCVSVPALSMCVHTNRRAIIQLAWQKRLMHNEIYPKEEMVMTAEKAQTEQDENEI